MENKLSVAAHKPGTVKNSDIFLGTKSTVISGKLWVGWKSAFYNIVRTLAGSL